MILSASALGTRCLPIGLLSCDVSQQNLPLIWDTSTCSACQSRANSYCAIESGRWKCVICENWNALESDKTREFSFSAYEVSIPTDHLRQRRIHHVILLLDQNLPSKEILVFRDCLNEALRTLPDDSYFGLVTFGNSVRIFELGSLGNKIGCEVFEGSMSPSNEDVREIARHENISSGCESFIAPLHVCRGSLFKILTLIAQGNEHCPTPHNRCLGSAVEYALNLLKICDAFSGTIVVETSGAANVGPGCWRDISDDMSSEARELIERDRRTSMTYFASLSTFAKQIHCDVDIFCCGVSHVYGSSSLLELTPNVYMRSAACAKSLNIALKGECHHSRRISVKVSDQKKLNPVHVSGATRNKDRFLTFETLTSATVFFEERSTQSTMEIYVQSVSRQEYRDRETVITEKLSRYRPFSVINGEAIAVLIAKRACVILSSNGNVELAKRHVENELYNLSRLLGEGIIDQPDFEKIARLLFHFYRGPLMDGPGSQYSEEDAECVRSYFLLQMDFYHATVMMAPVVKSFRWGRVSQSSTNNSLSYSPSDVPLSTLSLQSDTCLVLDQLTDVFVWFGSDVPREARERSFAIAYANTTAESNGRYPVSRVMHFEEYDIKSRWLRSRMSPEHKDTALVPSSEDVRQLYGKLWNLVFDDLTFSAFLKIALGDSKGRSN